VYDHEIEQDEAIRYLAEQEREYHEKLFADLRVWQEELRELRKQIEEDLLKGLRVR
jgi:hypothetical protein